MALVEVVLRLCVIYSSFKKQHLFCHICGRVYVCHQYNQCFLKANCILKEGHLIFGYMGIKGVCVHVLNHLVCDAQFWMRLPCFTILFN